jgi:hypothetical protein
MPRRKASSTKSPPFISGHDRWLIADVAQCDQTRGLARSVAMARAWPARLG